MNAVHKTNRIDITNMVSGKLRALRYLKPGKHGYAIWLCRCECGKEIEVPSYYIRKGKKTHCGCSPFRNTSPAIKEITPTPKPIIPTARILPTAIVETLLCKQLNIPYEAEQWMQMTVILNSLGFKVSTKKSSSLSSEEIRKRLIVLRNLADVAGLETEVMFNKELLAYAIVIKVTSI